MPVMYFFCLHYPSVVSGHETNHLLQIERLVIAGTQLPFRPRPPRCHSGIIITRLIKAHQTQTVFCLQSGCVSGPRFKVYVTPDCSQDKIGRHNQQLRPISNLRFLGTITDFRYFIPSWSKTICFTLFSLDFDDTTALRQHKVLHFTFGTSWRL